MSARRWLLSGERAPRLSGPCFEPAGSLAGHASLHDGGGGRPHRQFCNWPALQCTCCMRIGQRAVWHDYDQSWWAMLCIRCSTCYPSIRMPAFDLSTAFRLPRLHCNSFYSVMHDFMNNHLCYVKDGPTMILGSCGSAQMARTLYEKLWDEHLVREES